LNDIYCDCLVLRKVVTLSEVAGYRSYWLSVGFFDSSMLTV